MDSEHKVPNPVPTTALITSFAEAVEAGNNLRFPILAVPLGAEVYGTKGWLFQTSEEITCEALEVLLTEALPLKGKPTVDFRSVHTEGNAPWKSLLAQNGPRIDLFYT